MQPPWHNENVANDGAHVDQQIGVNYGETTFHRNEFYNTDGPPEQKFRAAVGLLKAGMPRHAEHILHDLIRTGNGNTERAYYCALAVLDGRSYDEIDKAVYEKYNDATRIASVASPPDKWTVAVDAVRAVVDAAQRRGARSTGNGDEQLVVKQLETLPDEQRGEIFQSLDRLFDGVVQDRLDRQVTEHIVTSRMADSRTSRAWKFFEAIPAAPRPYVPPKHVLDNKTMMRAWAGGVVMLISAIASFGADANIAGVLVGLAIIGAGSVLAIQHGSDRARPAYRRKRKTWEYNHPVVAPVSPGHWVSTAFVKEIHERVETAFRQARPHVAGQWAQDTTGLREYFKERFVAQYGNAQVEAGAVTWLMRWHAKQIATLWQAGNLAYRWAVPDAPVKTRALYAAGVVVAAIGLVTLASAGAAGAAVLMGVSLFFAVTGAIEVRAAGVDYEEAKAEQAAVLVAEQQAYDEWRQVLHDRPTDAEMGKWFEFDKAYLKRVALERCGMTNKDLVTYVVVTQGANGAMRARINRAPVRYSAYVVLVFLLTRSGVREIEVDLDFLTGKVHDERRTAFRYDSLASARVAEIGVREATDGAGFAQSDGPLEVARLRSREFRLSLVNGDDIRVKVENFRGLTDVTAEEEPELQRMALQVSGIAAAIHVLEAVAAEGSEWISREEERKTRWAANLRAFDGES
ncbi:hypothetical protein DMH04_33380 [Kibdelosporangium aridum]|uniref:Uncharacterized protein n=2 Tax=Kibdelosporangium aridum TaxID=2030 RepID=A0A428Z157_KIBAR|nr:hypothetical protein DMH04_33380 [Kibdelosporangium aridum]